MILQSLYKDADAIMKQTGQGVMPPSMYIPKPLRWIFEINSDVRVPPRFFPMVMQDQKGREKPISRLLPDTKRAGSVIRPCLLADDLTYSLGLLFSEQWKGKDEKRERERAAQKHEAFKNLLRLCAEDTKNKDVSAIYNFLNNWNPSSPSLPLPKELSGPQVVTFRLDGKPLPIDDLMVRSFWASYSKASDDSSQEHNPPMQCLVSGIHGPVVEMLPVTIKGIPNSNQGRCEIVSGNFVAVESYGLKRARTSPISAEAGERFGKALNALLASERHHLRLENLVYVYWSVVGTPKLLPFVINPDPGEVKKLFASVQKGIPWSQYDNDARFHIFGLSANKSRAVVRTELDTTIKKVGETQAEWFKRLEVIGPDGQQWRPLGIKGPQGLAVAPYRDFKDIAPGVEDALVQAALNHERHRLPEALLQAVVMRCRVGTKVGDRLTHVTYARAALLKYILTQHLPLEETEKMSTLNPEETDTAYLCGRLLAQLEYIQYRSRGKGNPANATLVDRFYGGASTTPRTVFPALLRMATQAHLPQIRRESGNRTYMAIKGTLAEIAGKIGTDFPSHLTVRQQGQFALGYYFQSAYRPDTIGTTSSDPTSSGDVVDEKQS